MSKRSRRNHSAVFKAKVALAAVKGEQTAVQLAERFDVHPHEVGHWKAQLLECAAEDFAGERDAAGEGVNLKELHAKIGQLALENDFIRRARAVARTERQTMIDRDHELSLTRQAALLELSRASLYY